jgi:F-type H+-transporting ATPase subunit a
MHISLAAEKLFQIGWFPVTNSLITTWIVMAILILVAILASRNIRLIPRGLQNMLEFVIEQLLKLMEDVTGSKKNARKFFPVIATIFIFVTSANWFGLVPGIGTIGLHETYAETTDIEEQADISQTEIEAVIENKAEEEVAHAKTSFIPLFRPANTDLNTTLAIAIIAVLSVQFFGITGIGLFKYGSKFINFRGPIDFFIGILELISEVAKVISFAFRLFGNIFAGEVLLVVIAVLLPFVAPLPFYFLEIFVGFIQGLVFAMLTLVFMTIAVTPHDEH